MAVTISRGGWTTVEFDEPGGDFSSPSVTMDRLYGEVEFAIEDQEQNMADGTIAQAGVGVTATIRSLDITQATYTPIKNATQDISKMDVQFNALKEGHGVQLHNCSVRYAIELGAAGDFTRSRVIVNGFAHDIDDLLTVLTGA
jgi:hypothetical protein